MGTACHENHNASLGFSRADKSVPDTTGGVVLYGGDTPISGQPDSRGGGTPYKEKKTLPETLADVSEFVCVTAPDEARTRATATPAARASVLTTQPNTRLSPWAGSGILTRFPFAPGGCQLLWFARKAQHRRRTHTCKAPHVSVPSHRIA